MNLISRIMGVACVLAPSWQPAEAQSALFAPPLCSQYLSVTRDNGMHEGGMLMLPSLCNLTWVNYSPYNSGTNYAWATEGLPVAVCDEDEMTVNFPAPDASEDTPFQLYTMPSLTTEGGGSSETFTLPCELAVGGSPYFNGEKYGLLPFDMYSDGIDYFTIDSDGDKASGIPIFGYSDRTDDYWRLYTCGGNPDNLPDIPYAYVSGIINAIPVVESPLVVKGAWLNAFGKLSDDARFTCTIYSLDSDGAFSIPVATAEASGADVEVYGSESDMNYYMIPFEFDAPVVLDESGTAGGLFAIMVSGFHDGGVEYFAPLMQVTPNPCEICLGFYQIEYNYKNRHEVGLSFVASHLDAAGREMFCAFAINLDAEMPWLTTENSTLAVSPGTPAAMKIDSYYPAEQLQVTLANGMELPEWLKCEMSGRFRDAILTFTVDEDAPDLPEEPGAVIAKVQINSTGVAETVTLERAEYVGIQMAESASSSVAYFDISGRPVEASRLSPGIYLEVRNNTHRLVRIQ